MTKFFKFLILISYFFAVQKLNSQPIIPCAINQQSLHWKGYVAACMMFQNEARYLREWLEYHKEIGISHFYLYNNASSDDFWLVLMPYVMKGEVELFDLHEKTANVHEHNDLQRQVYNHAVSLAKGYYEWLAILDSDEFICMTHQKNLRKFLKSYMYGTGLVVNWLMFGSSGIEKLGPNDLQIERFVHRAPDNWEEHFLYKSIVRPAYVISADIHTCTYHPDMPVYADHQKFSHTPTFAAPPIEEIRIHHYWWRDEDYFRRTKLPRRSGWLSKLTEEEVDARRKIYNSIYDPSMVPFVEKVKKRIRKKIN
jgi:hypothetical protein